MSVYVRVVVGAVNVCKGVGIHEEIRSKRGARRDLG